MNRAGDGALETDAGMLGQLCCFGMPPGGGKRFIIMIMIAMIILILIIIVFIKNDNNNHHHSKSNNKHFTLTMARQSSGTALKRARLLRACCRSFGNPAGFLMVSSHPSTDLVDESPMIASSSSSSSPSRAF